jgi:hypothetical protein
MILARRKVRSKFDVIRWKVIKLYLKACVFEGASPRKGNPVHLAPAYAGFDHFGSYVHNLSLHFCKRVFP